MLRMGEALNAKVVIPFHHDIWSCRILAARKIRVEHRHIAKRYIGDSQIKMVHERLFYLLEALYPYFLSGMQVLQYLARHQVFLKSHDVRVRSVLQHGVHECTDTCRRLQHPVGLSEP